MYPVLATWFIVRMTVTKNIPSYIKIGSYRAIGKYRVSDRLADFVTRKPILVIHALGQDETERP